MNILHLCHWSNKNNFKQQICLLGQGDSLSIYGQINSNDEQWLLAQLAHFKHPCYLVKQQPNPKLIDNEVNVREINIEQWLALMIEHSKTLAWK